MLFTLVMFSILPFNLLRAENTQGTSVRHSSFTQIPWPRAAPSVMTGAPIRFGPSQKASSSFHVVLPSISLQDLTLFIPKIHRWF